MQSVGALVHRTLLALGTALVHLGRHTASDVTALGKVWSRSTGEGGIGRMAS